MKYLSHPKWKYLRGILMLLVLSASAVPAHSQQAQFGQSNPLLGGAGTAGTATADALSLNPAHAGALERSEVQVRWGYSKYDYIQRYPGFEAHSSGRSGLNPKFPIPGFIYKLSRRLGLGGIVIPFPVKQEINVKDLPIVVLGQQNNADLIGSGQLNAYVDLSLGYEFSKEFSAGLNFLYQGIKGSGSLFNAGTSGDPFATFAVTSATTGVGFGLKATFGVFSVGFLTRVFEMVASQTSFDSKLAKNDAANAEGGGSGEATSTELFNPIRLGTELKIGGGLALLGDFEYRRANKNQSRYSVVDLAEKQLDVYDTLSVFLGLDYQQSSQSRYMAGYLNQPSSVGEGSVGKTGKAGFGFFDLAMGLGEPPSAPVWAVGGGGRFDFDRIPLKKRDELAYRMAVEAGIVYSETSIGISAEGEQPGAYLVRRYTIPLRFIYRF